MTSETPTRSSRDTALAGWRSRVAAIVSAALMVQALTGLWMYVGPFSRAAQIQVLLHVGVGLLLIVPFCIYQWDHFRRPNSYEPPYYLPVVERKSVWVKWCDFVLLAAMT